METKNSRRTFLKTTGALLAGATVGTRLEKAMAAESKAAAGERKTVAAESGPTGKYDKYFIEKSLRLPNPVEKVRECVVPHLYSVDGEESAGIPGAFLMESQMVVRATDPKKFRSRPHCHDFDEYMVFASTDPDDIDNLGGEVEVYIENERHVITKSTAIFFPRFTMHLPVNILRVERPFMWLTTANTTKFSIYQYDNAPEFADLMTRSGLAEITVKDKTYETTGSYLEYLQWQMEKSRKERGM